MVTVVSPHVSDAEIDLFRRRQLPARALVAFSDHLAGCAECRARVSATAGPEGPAYTTAAAAALNADLGLADDLHVPEADIHAYVDGGLDSERREWIASHIAECPACAEEVRDLSEFAAAFHRARPARSQWTYLVATAAAVLLLAAGAVLFRSGRQPAPVITSGSGGLAALAPADAARVRNALASGRLSLPAALSSLSGRRGALLGTGDSTPFTLVSPVATVVLDTRPALRWTALSGSPTYTVTVQDDSGGTVSSPGVRDTTWTPQQPLTAGHTYTWQVSASVGGKDIVSPRPPSPPARFAVADPSVAARLQRLPASPLVRGVLYADAGLLDDAEREFSSIGSGDDDAGRARTFLAQVRDARAPR
jgi:anti-sigma factor RsiW